MLEYARTMDYSDPKVKDAMKRRFLSPIDVYIDDPTIRENLKEEFGAYLDVFYETVRESDVYKNQFTFYGIFICFGIYATRCGFRDQLWARIRAYNEAQRVVETTKPQKASTWWIF